MIRDATGYRAGYMSQIRGSGVKGGVAFTNSHDDATVCFYMLSGNLRSTAGGIGSGSRPCG